MSAAFGTSSQALAATYNPTVRTYSGHTTSSRILPLSVAKASSTTSDLEAQTNPVPQPSSSSSGDSLQGARNSTAVEANATSASGTEAVHHVSIRANTETRVNGYTNCGADAGVEDRRSSLTRAYERSHPKLRLCEFSKLKRCSTWMTQSIMYFGKWLKHGQSTYNPEAGLNFPGEKGRALLIAWRDARGNTWASFVHVDRKDFHRNEDEYPDFCESETEAYKVGQADFARRESHEATWQRIKYIWEEVRPWWFCMVPSSRTNIEEVEVRLNYRDADNDNRYSVGVVYVENENLDAMKQAAQSIVDAGDESRSYHGEGFELDLYGDLTADRYRPCCDNLRDCVYQDYHLAKDRLIRLECLEKTNPFLSYLQDPRRARFASIRPLSGLKLTSCVLSKADAKIRLLNNEKVVALFIGVDSRISRMEWEVLVGILFVAFVVSIWRLITGSWSVGSGFGSIAATFVAILVARNEQNAGKKAKSE